MRQTRESLKCARWPLTIAVVLGLVACTSSSSGSGNAVTCSSPPAVSRPIGYPGAEQNNRSTWGSIVAHVDEQFNTYSAYRFGFTDPSGVEHLSNWAASATLAEYPDEARNGNVRSFRVLFKIGHDATTLTVYGLGKEGQPGCFTAPETQYGINGNQGETGQVIVQPPSQSPVSAYRPDWASS